MSTTTLPLRPAGNPATSAVASTESLIANLPVKLDAYPNCYPEVNPIDVYRSHLTSLLRDVTGVDPTIIYNALQWTQSQDKGDLILAIPALRVKGKKPDELAKEWVDKVCPVSLRVPSTSKMKIKQSL
jgi:arginyl-tRNA synthetase